MVPRIPSKEFHGANKACRALELLCGEHSQRVAHQHIGAISSQQAGDGRQQALVEHVERDDAEIGFSLSAAGGEPDQVDSFSVGRMVVRCSID